MNIIRNVVVFREILKEEVGMNYDEIEINLY